MRGESVSEFLRNSAAERAHETLAANTPGRFADVAGVVHGGGGSSRSGEAFREVLADRSSEQ